MPLPSRPRSKAVFSALVYVNDGKFTYAADLHGALTIREYQEALEGLIRTLQGEAAAHGIVLQVDEVPF